MNRKAKLLYIFFGLIALFTFLSTNIAYSSAPGVTEPGKRVATRTADANTKKKPAPAKRPSKPKQATPPAVASLPEPIFDSAISQLNMGIAFIEQERYQKALPYIVCSLNQQPGNPDAWYWFGVWNNKTGNFSNAQKYFAKALEIDPNYPALNRIVVYPDDPYEKIPLWDPRRPTDIEAIFPLKEMDVVAYGSPESLREPRPEMEYRTEIPVYFPPLPEE